MYRAVINMDLLQYHWHVMDIVVHSLYTYSGMHPAPSQEACIGTLVLFMCA